MIRKIVIMLAATIAFAAGAAAQDLTVTGSVTDREGYPLEGATVLVKGTTRGVTSDPEGRFEISAAPDAVLVLHIWVMCLRKSPSGESIQLILSCRRILSIWMM